MSGRFERFLDWLGIPVIEESQNDLSYLDRMDGMSWSVWLDLKQEELDELQDYIAGDYRE